MIKPQCKYCLAGSDLCDATTWLRPHPDAGGQADRGQHRRAPRRRCGRRRGGRHRVDSGLRDQPALLLPEQRGAGRGAEPLAEVEDGSLRGQDCHTSQHSRHLLHLLCKPEVCRTGKYS